MRESGSAQIVLDASITALLTVPRVSLSLANRLVEARHCLDVVERRWESLKQLAAQTRFCDEPDFPRNLRALNNAPSVLITVGAHQEYPADAVAIVGTVETARLAATIARSLGPVVVSGLARGIDGAAHHAALDVDPDAPTKRPLPATIAVLGSALTALYPAENHGLAEKIKDRGPVVTERLSASVRAGPEKPHHLAD